MLFVQGLMSALQRQLARVPSDLRYKLVAIFGLVALAAPLALWVSMTLWGLRLILAIWAASILIISLLIWSSPDEYF